MSNGRASARRYWETSKVTDLQVLAIISEWATRVRQRFWAVIPEALFLPGFFLPEPEVLTIESLPCPEDVLSDMVKGFGDRQIKVVLRSEVALSRMVTLPKAAKARADAAIGLQMRQSLPAGGKGLVWRTTGVSELESQLVYRVSILKQSQLDSLRARLGDFSARVTAIDLEGNAGECLWSAVRSSNRRRNLYLAVTCGAMILSPLILVVQTEREVSRLQAQNQEAEARLIVLQDRLLAAKADEADALSEVDQINDAARIFNLQSSRLKIFADLTNALSDDVWISEMTVTGDQISLSGFASGDLTDVSQSLGALTWATAVQLAGPVSYDSQTGQNRFQMTVQISPEVENQ